VFSTGHSGWRSGWRSGNEQPYGFGSQRSISPAAIATATWCRLIHCDGGERTSK
jgi:hypothetical protein